MCPLLLVCVFKRRIVASQYCGGFCCTTTWTSCLYTSVPSLLSHPPMSLPHPIPPPRSSQSTRLSPLGRAAVSHQLSVLPTVGYVFPATLSMHPTFSLPPPRCPQVHPLHLCLYSCPASRLISTIFLDSTDMH